MHAMMVDALVAHLHCAVLADDCASVARYGRACAAAGVLDQRSFGACQRSSGSGKLVGLPHLLLVYRGDTRVLEAVLERITDDLLGEHASCWCKGGKDCPGGPTALHLAVGQGSVECVRTLLRLGADAELPFCFAVDARDVPVKGDFESICGIAAYSPYQLAAHRGHKSCAALLVEHNAAPANHPDSECPICYELLDGQEGSALTTTCGHRFHARCVQHRHISACPLCRTLLGHHSSTYEKCAAELEGPPSTPATVRAASSTGTDGSETPRGRAATAAQSADSRGYVCAEPSWILSPALAPERLRVYTETERRRM